MQVRINSEFWSANPYVTNLGLHRFLAFPILTQVASFTSTQHACTIKAQIKPRPGRIHQRDKMRLFTRQLQPSPEMKERVTGVERIVGYDFMDKTLLEEALTHPSLMEHRRCDT
ncbi:unnamed protein product [Prunus armeniaca]